MGVKLGNGKWAIKEDKLLAYNDNSGRFFNKEFDFSRGSSATYVAKDGLIENTTGDIPRIDFTDTSKGALLLEPQSTNVLENSEITSTWTYTEYGSGSSGTITTGKTDMFGSTNAVQIDFPADAENVSFTFGQTSSSISSGSVSGSVYIKLVESGSKTLQLRCSSGLKALVNIDTTNFVRYQLLGTKNNNEAFNLKLRPSEGTSSGGFSIIVCQPQEEALSYPTSYIPTSGSTVTRNADLCNNSGSAQDFNSEEGVLYAEIAALADDLTSRVISLSDGTANERVVLQYHNTTNRIRCFIKSGGSFYATLDKVVSDITDFHKIAYKYKSGETKLFVDGSLITSSSNTFSITGLNVLQLANGTPSASPLQGKVRELQVFTEA